MPRADRVNRLIAGTCMVLSPFMLLVGAILMPGLDDDAGAQLASISDHLDRWLISSLLVLCSLALAVPAVLGLAHMLRERQPALALAGVGAALVGILASVGITAIGLVAWQMAQSGSRVQMVALLDSVTNTAGIWIPFQLFGFALAIGLILLAGGLTMTRIVNAPMALLIAVGGVCAVIGYPLASALLMLIGAACLCLGLGATGLMVLRESDADWEHTPAFRGMRGIAGAH